MTHDYSANHDSSSQQMENGAASANGTNSEPASFKDYAGVKPPTKKEQKEKHKQEIEALHKEKNWKEKACNAITYVLPIIEWGPQYKWKEMLLGDVISGITVGVMLVPQGMAYSLLATLPPEYGLYSSTIPIFVYALFGSSKHLAVGPVAVVSLLVAEALETNLPDHDDPSREDKKVDLAIILALLVGLISTILAIFRAGVVASFISHAVLIGFTTGAAIVIGLSQLKHLLGFNIPRYEYPLETLIYALKNIKDTQPATITMGIVAIVLLLIMRYTKRWWASKPVVPGTKSPGLQALEKWSKRIIKLICNLSALVVVIIGTLVTEYLYKEHGYTRETLPIVGRVPEGIPAPRVPPVADYGETIPNLFVSALVICILGFMESYAVADAYARKDGTTLDANQELSGLGLANMIGSFFNAFPVTGGFSRTAVQADAGCKSPIAMFISGLVVIIALVSLTSAFYYMPNNVLAAIIFVAVSGLFNFGAVREAYKVARPDFWAMIVTFLATVGLGVEIGLAVGFGTSVILILQRVAFPHTAILGEMPSKETGEPIYRNVLRFPNARTFDGVIIFRMDAPLWFASSGKFGHKMLKFCSDSSIHTIILDFSAIDFVDLAGLEKLLEVQNMLEEKNVTFIAAAVKGPVRDTIEMYNEYEAAKHPGAHPILPWKDMSSSKAEKSFMVATVRQAVQLVEENMKISIA